MFSMSEFKHSSKLPTRMRGRTIEARRQLKINKEQACNGELEVKGMAATKDERVEYNHFRLQEKIERGNLEEEPVPKGKRPLYQMRQSNRYQKTWKNVPA